MVQRAHSSSVTAHLWQQANVQRPAAVVVVLVKLSFGAIVQAIRRAAAYAVGTQVASPASLQMSASRSRTAVRRKATLQALPVPTGAYDHAGGPQIAVWGEHQ